MLCHIVVHAAGRLTPLAPFEAAALTWRRLREEHPLALAAVLMPDHLISWWMSPIPMASGAAWAPS
ncbi:MAG TPA: hypothetical protein VGQ83_25465 [Polyangia bacterium]|jgi:hypothetical protein